MPHGACIFLADYAVRAENVRVQPTGQVIVVGLGCLTSTSGWEEWEMSRNTWAGFALLLTLAPSVATAQFRYFIPDSGNGGRVMLFNENGNLLNANWITDVGQPFTFTTPKEAPW